MQLFANNKVPAVKRKVSWRTVTKEYMQILLKKFYL